MRRGLASVSAGEGKRRTGHAGGVGARLQYAFDNSMSRGPGALVWYLGAAVVFVVVLFAVLILIVGAGPTHNPITALYNVLLHTIDTGTQANDTGTSYEVLDLIVTFSGILIFSAFIGVLANGIDSRLQELRRGRSAVLEHDHTLILGWSESVYTVVSELSVANESRTRPSVVVLADRDKVEMEEAIRERVPDLRGTRLICRSGSPTSLVDLARVSHATARSVIVLATEAEYPDAMVIKTLLALTHASKSAEPRPGGLASDVPGYHVVAEIQDRRNLEAARLAGGDSAVIIDKGLTVSRLIVQTSRQSGAAIVYQELLDFDGDEIYMRHDSRLTGKTYGEALFAYETCTVIGLRSADGTVTLNPPSETVLDAGTDVIAIAEDDSVLDAAGESTLAVDTSVIVSEPLPVEDPQLVYILGYNDRSAAVINELDNYLQPGSRVEVVAVAPPAPETLSAEVGPLRNVALGVQAGDTADRRLLDRLELAEAGRVIVMCDSLALDRGQADARVLATLLHLRDISERRGIEITIVSEILDEADRDLARVASVDDIVVSDQIISYLLSQISETRALADVFTQLLQADGSEIYLRPAETYVPSGAEVSFATLVEAARQRGETAIGYRVAAIVQDDTQAFGVRVNPAKGERFRVTSADRLIVLADD